VVLPDHLVPVGVAGGAGLVQVRRVAVVEHVRAVVLPDDLERFGVVRFDPGQPLGQAWQLGQDRKPGVQVARSAAASCRTLLRRSPANAAGI
jgi:hypothetical protein